MIFVSTQSYENQRSHSLVSIGPGLASSASLSKSVGDYAAFCCLIFAQRARWAAAILLRPAADIRRRGRPVCCPRDGRPSFLSRAIASLNCSASRCFFARSCLNCRITLLKLGILAPLLGVTTRPKYTPRSRTCPFGQARQPRSTQFPLRFLQNGASYHVVCLFGETTRRQQRKPRLAWRFGMIAMAGEPGPRDRFQLSPVDRLGRAIDPVILDAAAKIGPRAIAYAEKLIRDPAVAANLLEEAAAAVSRALRRAGGPKSAPIRDLQAYLFRAFIRRVNKVKSRTLVLDIHGRSPEAGPQPSERFELKILVDEFLRGCDPATRDMFYRRIQGFSWKEIGKVYAISAHAAESRFSQALQRVRKRLGLEL